MLKKEQCANYRPGFINCELCVLNKEYINLQNTNCKSCFKSVLNMEK